MNNKTLVSHMTEGNKENVSNYSHGIKGLTHKINIILLGLLYTTNVPEKIPSVESYGTDTFSRYLDISVK